MEKFQEQECEMPILKIRYDNIDILKTISIIMVILLHTLEWNINFLENNALRTYLNFFVRIMCEGVPIFIVINGFLIINKQFYLEKFLKKILRIFLILLIWSAIYVVIIMSIKGENIYFKEIIKNIATTNIANYYTGVLWFLQDLIILYLFFPILKIVHDNNKKVYNYFFMLVTFFSIGMPLISNMLVILGKLANIDYKYFNIFIERYDFISNGTFLFYFMLGGYLFEKKEIFEIKKNRIIAFFIGILSSIIVFVYAIVISKITNMQVASNFNYSSVFWAITIIGIYAITYKYKNNEKYYNKIIMDIGKNTLGIYLIHRILVVWGIQIIETNSLKPNLLFSIIIFIFSYLINKLIQKIPIINKIVQL